MTQENISLKIFMHYENMSLPKKAHEKDTGIDLVLMQVIQKRKHVFFFDLGVSIEPPSGYYVALYPRSSIYKTDFIQTNSVGIIDEEYRGKIYMPVRYLGEKDGLNEAKNLIGTRVAQIILKKRVDLNIEQIFTVSTTKRGEGGFGSTGK